MNGTSHASARMGVAVLIIGLLIVFFRPFDYFSQLTHAAPFIIGLSILGIALTMLLNAFAYNLLLARGKYSMPYIEALRSVFFAWSAESLLPGKLGSFSVAWIWKKKGIPLVEGLSVVLVYRVVVGLLTFAVAVAAALLFFPAIFLPLPLVAGGMVALVVGMYYVMYSSFFVGLVARFFPSIKEHVKVILQRMRETTSCPSAMLQLVVNALAQLGITAFLFTKMFEISGVSVGFEIILGATALTQMAALIPLSINGLGIREGLFSVLLSLFGVPVALTLVIAGVNTATGYAATFVISTLWAKKWATQNEY